VATVLGNESGVFVWGCAAAFGFTALLAASQIAYDGMPVVGACVLLWFGIQSFRSARKMKRDDPSSSRPTHRSS
jgi:threonine/homoserine/homoserine lactone efflux protein